MTDRLPTRQLSIEYAHIYTNQKVSEEHELSLHELKKALSLEAPHDAVLVVMVDDYSFPDPTFSYDDFTAWLTNQGYKPDLVLRESQLIPVCDEVLKLLPENSKLKSQLVDYVKAKKYPCSLFIAAWYLLRLGYIEHPIFDSRLSANKLLNILPESFRPFEEKAWDIIKEAGYENELDNISYRWIEGRLIA